MRTISAATFFLVLATAGCRRGEREPLPPSVSELKTMLVSADPKTQNEAAAWVRQLGPKAAETVPALITALKSPEMSVRQNAAVALSQVGPDAAQAIPALTDALSDPEEPVRRSAADTLGSLGPAAASAIPALEALDRRGDKCNAAPAALKKIRQ